MLESISYDPNALEAACEELGLDLVVAFGSRVSGDPPPSEESDLDLAVLDREKLTWDRFASVRSALGKVFGGVELDVAFLRDAEPLFRFEIFRTAEPIFGDPDVYAAQKAYAYKAYVDSADLRRLERVLFEKKLALIDRELNA